MTHLVQLVSDQTMPNVLAALALEPAHITLLHTPRTEPQAAWINNALRRAGLQFEAELRPLSTTPDVNETGAAVRTAAEAAVAASLAPVINITGGTKLMSLGAFAATHSQGWPALYVDSENRRFLQVGNHLLPEPLRDGWAALTRAEGRLNVDVVAAAHGCEHVSGGADPAPFLELAEYLRTHPQEESACHALFSPITTRGKPADLLATIGQPLPPLPSIIGELAVAAGLLQRSGDRVHLACPSRDTLERACREQITTKDLFAATRSVQFAQAFLSGGWWEVCVWHAARQSGAFRDLRWSVRFGSETDHLEEDLVGVAGLNLALFSCKRGGDGARLNRAFEEFVAAAQRLGGSFASKHFCVALPISQRHYATVRTEASRTRTRLIGPASRLNSASFATS
ncbi:MAG TPA: DUF1887 family CARF protein [Opitutaceae bacterium]|nr:DUF1887 family CARF protein [Opitutaceae bacterium]